MSLKRAILKGFDSEAYTATLELNGSQRVYLEDVGVARNLAAGKMVVGRKVAVIFFDEHNANEAVVMAVYT